MNKEVVIIWDLSESSGGTFAATAHVEARFSCYFHILFTSRTLQISHVKASFLRKIFARFQMLGNNAKKKKKRKSITSSSELQIFSGVLTTTHMGYLASKLIEKVMNKGGKVLTKLWCYIGGRV